MPHTFAHSRTPLRISFVGGGTDLPAFYRKHGGSVISTAISCYLDVLVRVRPLDSSFRYLSARGTMEDVETVDDITDGLTAESLRAARWPDMTGAEIVYSADVPFGTGLGSSSAYTVGLLKALYSICGETPPAPRLADEACRIEIDRVGKPIGRQDQYIVAHGGFRRTDFQIDDRVTSTVVDCPPGILKAIENHLLLFYLGGNRSADPILKRVQRAMERNEAAFGKLASLCDDLESVLTRGTQLSEFGEILHCAWQLKRSLDESITNSRIDTAYHRSRARGAIGGKLLGAGGTGFLLLFVPPDRQSEVCEELCDYGRLPVRFDPIGSRIMSIG